MDLGQTVRANWSWADNRGGTRYLRKCFIEQQVLKIIGTESDIRYLDVEREPDKFKRALPAYAKLLEGLAKLEGNGAANLATCLQPFYEDSGQGEIALTLMMLLARRYYGDSLRFKRDPNSLTDLQFSTTDDMIDLVKGNSPTAVVIFERVSQQDVAYFSKVYHLFSQQGASADQTITINQAYQAISDWWSSLPIIARAMELYDEAEQGMVDLMNRAATSDPYIFIKQELVEQSGFARDEVITTGKLTRIEVNLKAFKANAEAIINVVEGQVLEGAGDIFGSERSLDLDIQEAMREWYDGLSSTQRDQHATYHNNDSKPLVRYTSYTNIRELLFKTYPESYGFEALKDWSSDQVGAYLIRLGDGKRHIEENAPDIGILDIYYSNDLSEDGNQVSYRGELTIYANVKGGDGKIYYTDDGSDPRNSPQRQALTTSNPLTVVGNRTVRLVIADEKGNYSSVRTIEAIDDLNKYKIQRPQQCTMGDERINFVFPKDKDSASTVIHSMLDEISRANILREGELKETISEAMEYIKKDK